MPVPRLNYPVSVALLAIPEVSAAVLYGMQEILASVGRTWEQITRQPASSRTMNVRIAGQSKEKFKTGLGVPLQADFTFRSKYRADIVIVADLAIEPGVEESPSWNAAQEWLRQQYDLGATVCSVCTGSLLLAAAGLLDGLEATSHWSAAGLFRERYPAVRLHTERVLCPAGPGHRIVTGGGSASWSDLVLYLVARFCGQDEARRIAKIFVLGDRGNGQLPFAAMVRPSQHDDAVISRCQLWISGHYPVANPVAAMIRESGLAERTFKRRFRNATGYTPIEYVQTLRTEEAKQMLESGDQPIDDVAEAVGYRDPNSFRRLFKRTTGITPQQYRRQFRHIGQAARALE